MGSDVFQQGFVPKTGRTELELLAAGNHGGTIQLVSCSLSFVLMCPRDAVE